MESPPQTAKVPRLLASFVRHGVDFVVVGGMAGTAQGSSLVSYDLDLAYARDHQNIERLVGALEDIGVRLRGVPADLPFQLDACTIENGANFTFSTDLGDLDILGDIAGIKSYGDLRESADVKRLGSLEVPVASIDHLIAMKRAANRPKDRVMLEEYLVIADERRLAGPDQSS